MLGSIPNGAGSMVLWFCLYYPPRHGQNGSQNGPQEIAGLARSDALGLCGKYSNNQVFKPLFAT